MLMCRSVRLMFVCLLLVTLAIPAFGQSQASTGQITGTVKDAAGALIPKAELEALNLANGLKQTTVTNEDGVYRFVLLPPGRYSVSASASGFAKSVAELAVGVGRTADLS